MMEILLLALAVGLTCADPVDDSAITGDWRTIALSANNVEKIEENGDLRIHIREIISLAEGSQLSIRWYVKLNGECKESTVVATGDIDGTYTVEFAGGNTFQILRNKDDIIVFYNINTAENGLVTRGIIVAGKRDYLTPIEAEELEEASEERGIPKENIRYLAGTDDCPE